MAKATEVVFAMVPVIRVDIRIKETKTVNKEDSIFFRFLGFLTKEKVGGTILGARISDNSDCYFSGLCTAANAARIETWLCKHGGIKRKNP